MAWLLEGVTSRHFGCVRISLEAFFFFQIFGTKEKTEKFHRKIRKSGGKSPKFGIIDFSVDISYRSPPIADILAEVLEILFLDCSGAYKGH